jgi:hypothetical protein
MATPNIVGVTTINGLTTFVAVSSANTVLLANSSGSNLVFKINTIIVSNVDGTNACDLTLSYNTSAGGAGTSFRIANTISVPADASLVVLDKNSQIYLNEDKSIVCFASTSNDLEALISYEVIASG